MPPAAGAVLLVDADCGVCCWIGLRIGARMEGLGVTTIQSEAGSRLLAGMSSERAMGSWHLHANERTTSGAAVLGGLLDVAGHRRAAALSRRAEPILGPVYRFGARHRDVWARVVPRPARQRAKSRLREG
jgi:predicted DCC family thiol-disulfide oxidoreductase YuxK